MVYDFMFPIKKPGAYQMRVAIRDTASNRVGSANQFVEIPNLKKNRLTLSGALLANMDVASWQKLDTMSPEVISKLIDPLSDTARRLFSPGSVLTYQTSIYNAKLDPTGRANLTVQAKLFGDQTLVFEGRPHQIEQPIDADLDSLESKGSMLLGKELPSGNYTLQVIVTDNNAKEGRKVTFQFVPFEIVR